MKLLKKVISIFLILSMLPFTVLAIEESGTEQKKHNEEACRLLTALGLIDDTFEFHFDKGISRMEFARVVLKAGGYSTEGYTPIGSFPDVSADNEYAGDIEVLKNYGVVNGEDGMFYPSRNVTYSEAIIMLLRAAGYGDIVDIRGGYLEGYTKTAREIGLLKNVTDRGSFVGDDMVVMVYNMLMLNTIDFYGTDGYRIDDEETVLSQRHSVYYRKGIVCENDVTALSSKTDVRAGEVGINTGTETVVMSVGDTDIDSKIGFCVSVYYRYDRSSDESECIYYEFESKNNIKEIDISDLEEFNNEKIEYTNGSRTSRVDIKGAAIIYNDAYYQGTALNTRSFDGKVGKITVVDNNSDGSFDVVSVEAFDTYVIGNAISKEKYVSDKVTGETVDISDEDIDKYKMSMADGKDAVFDDICLDTVLSVAKSAPDSSVKTVKIILSTKRVSGTMTSTKNDEGVRTVELDDLSTYKLLDRVEDSALPAAGSGVTLLLDAFDNVAYVEAKFMGDTQYGFMVDVKRLTNQEKAYVKLLTREGKIEKINLSEKIKVDGISFKNHEDVYQYISGISRQAIGGDYLPDGVMPVRYKLNDAGELKFLDTPETGDEEDPNSLKTMSSGDSVYASSTFGFNVPISGDTTVLRISTPDLTKKEYYQEEDRYTFGGITAFRERRVYTYAAYKIDPRSDYADLILNFTSGGGFDYDSELTVVKDYGVRELDEATDEIFIRFDGITGGRNVSYQVSKEYESKFLDLGLRTGDVIRCSIDDNDRINDIDGPIFTYDSTSRQMKVNNAGHGDTSISKIKNQETSAIILMGDVAIRKEGLIKLYHLNWGNTYYASGNISNIEDDPAREVFWTKIDGSVPVTVFDAAESKDPVYSGTYDDITAMNNSFDKHSVVVLRYRSDALKEVVVINNMYN